MAEFFDSDPRKAAANFRKHGVSFTEAETVFADQRGLDTFDDEHSISEDRFTRLGLSHLGRLPAVVYTEYTVDNDNITRLISARTATRSEVTDYQMGAGPRHHL